MPTGQDGRVVSNERPRAPLRGYGSTGLLVLAICCAIIIFEVYGRIFYGTVAPSLLGYGLGAGPTDGGRSAG